MRWFRPLAVTALCTTMLTALAACTTSPTGRSQLLLMSDDQLNQMGAQAFDQYQQKLPAADASSQRYVQCVAQAIVAELPGEQRQQNWEVEVFKADEPNAFALPGGYMGVNSGMLDVADNQAQLATVLGHEVGHVLANHANERASTESATQLGLSVLSSSAGIEGAGGEQLMGLLGMGAQYGILLPFSRRHESEADMIGLRLMAKAGFDPRESVTLWQNMQRAGGGAPPAWMSTHPSQGQRISGLEAGMQQALNDYQSARNAGRQPNCQRP
ncbi:M48 family metallopeptidase [Vreelandella subglaciescola]|uniref:Peptidase family M48 n=1 Tax=Vreelandella subglaciescola TaxID=29571 RepID=A0A1M7G2F3_9GAMM|nr:M48 family metallopeptidase [Halomonas subglaciescola]SHM10430.1 Peptidase family M48 [Halomonas subglaciescola]